MKKLQEPYFEKEICCGFNLSHDSQWGVGEAAHEVEVIGNDHTQPDDYCEFRKKHPDVMVFKDMGMVLCYSFADYENLKYDGDRI